MLTAPLFGALSDRWGRKRLILPGIATLSAGTILTGFGVDLSSLLVFRALTGIGAGMIEPSVFALVGDRFDYNQRGCAMGLVIGAMVASTLFGVPLGSFLAEVSDWHATFWVVGILALGLMLPADENELNHHVYVSHGQDPDRLEYQTPTGLIACAWDLRVLCFERDAWVELVLNSHAEPDIEGYLETRLNADV